MSVSILESTVAPVRMVVRQTTGSSAAITPLVTHCSNCPLRDLCLPCGMAGGDVERLDSLMFGRRRVPSGASI